MTSPTQRTLAHLRAGGWDAAVVERWNAHTRVRQDLFGFLDILALRAGEGFLGVQATSEGVAARVTKILALEAETGLPGRWLAAGGRIEVWGWGKRRSQARNADGSRSKRIEVRLRRVEIRRLPAGDLATQEIPTRSTPAERIEPEASRPRCSSPGSG